MSFQSPVIIALGANLPSRLGSPRTTLEIAIRHLRRAGLDIYRISPWFGSAPVPPSPQGLFLNGVALARTALDADRLISLLHRVERDFGRVRLKRNAARPLDLDLIAYGGRILAGKGPGGLVLPHPRAHQRAFVLQPLRLVAPVWRHPVLEERALELIRAPGRGIQAQRTFLPRRPLRPPPGRLKKVVRP